MATAKPLVALTSFACEVKGVAYVIRQGDPVAADHPAVKGREELFAKHDPAAPRDREAGAA
jgi:hypothetical protein